MKKSIMVIAGVFVAILAIFYFSRSGPFKKAESGITRAQVHQQHGISTPVQSERPQDSIPAEEPAAQPETAAGQVTTDVPAVEIALDKQRLIGVKIATASVQPLTKTIRTVGIVEYDQRRLHTINAKYEGWIERLYVNFTGTYVKKGDPVADIYSPELWATQQEFINVVKWAKASQRKEQKPGAEVSGGTGTPDIAAMIEKDAVSLVEAARQRLKLWDISDAQIREIEESKKPIRTLTLYSPYSGYVLQKNVTQGMRIMTGASLLDVADLSAVWVIADIYEFEMPLIKVGNPATVQLSYFPGRQFSTKIDYIYPGLEGETRTLKVRFTIPNEGGHLKPQMFANVELKINLGRKLAIPSDAVINTGVRNVAYVDKGDGNFEPREVTTGIQAESLIEITAGLKAGDKVSSSANFLIDSEAKLRGVEPIPRQSGQKRVPTQSEPSQTHRH